MLLAVAGCTGSSDRGPGEASKPVPPTAAPKPPPLETVQPSPAVAREGSKLPPPRAMRNWAEVRQQAAERLVAANPDITYTGKVPDQLLAIPVLEVELNADGSVRRIEVLRQPRQAKDTMQIAVDAVRRAAPFGDVSRLPKPWKFTETFLFDDAPQVQAAHAGQLTAPPDAGARHNPGNVLQPADAPHLGAHRRDPAGRRRVLPALRAGDAEPRRHGAVHRVRAHRLGRRLPGAQAQHDLVVRRLPRPGGRQVPGHARRCWCWCTCSALHAFVALVIIGREIAISALREWMAQIGASRSVAVHMLGKVKTIVQMIAIPFLLYRRHAVRPDRHPALGHGADLASRRC